MGLIPIMIQRCLSLVVQVALATSLPRCGKQMVQDIVVGERLLILRGSHLRRSQVAQEL